MTADLEQWRIFELEHGYIRARLTLTQTGQGGRQGPIASGYRSCWDISSSDDQTLLGDAPLLIEDAEWLGTGESAVVRLHPLFREYWTDVCDGQVLGMYEGSRRVGTATVLEVNLQG